MTRCAVLYATVEGHTAKVAQYLAAALRGAGLEVDEFDASALAPAFDSSSYERALLCAPIHLGRYPDAIVEFARAHTAWLQESGAALVSVSLSAIGEDDEDRANLATCIEHFGASSGWTPATVEHVAGAFVFSQYPFFVRQVMKLIARQHGLPTSGDHDYTDYARLDAFAREFAEKGAKPAGLTTGSASRSR